MDFELSDPEQIRLPKRAYPLDLNDQCVKRVIAIGDVHGCYDELVELMGLLAPAPEDLVVFLGDYIDRGPKSAMVIAYVKWMCENRPGTFAVLGNHDEKLVRHRRHEVAKLRNPAYRNPMKVHEDRAEEYALVSDEEVLWLSKRPAAIYTVGRRARIFTHAGLLPVREGHDWRDVLTQPMDGLIRNRYLRPAQPRGACGQQVVDLGWEPAPCVRGSHGEMLQPPGSRRWSELWTGPTVVYGHAVYDPVLVENNTFGVDTGCCFGGKLTAFVEEAGGTESSWSSHFVSVDARQTYSDRNREAAE